MQASSRMPVTLSGRIRPVTGRAPKASANLLDAVGNRHKRLGAVVLDENAVADYGEFVGQRVIECRFMQRRRSDFPYGRRNVQLRKRRAAVERTRPKLAQRIGQRDLRQGGAVRKGAVADLGYAAAERDALRRIQLEKVPSSTDKTPSGSAIDCSDTAF